MARPNICKEQSCNEEIKESHYLCREHWGKEQKGTINECPQCGVYKDAKHPYCRECNKKADATHRPVRAEECKEKTHRYDPGRANTPPIDLEKLQTSEPPPNPPSEASSRSKIRPPGTTGLPSAYERSLKREVSLDLSADADLPDRFIAALGELIREMKAIGTGQKRYELKEGRRGETAGGDIFYHFPFTDKIDREFQVEIQVGQWRVEGTIVSIGTGQLVLALEKDIGNEVSSAVLLINENDLLQALKEKIEKVNKGGIKLNRTLADAVVQPGDLPKRPARPIRADDGSELEESQREAYQTALREALTFIWGPPGCGKTMTLGAIVRSAFNSGKRTLICSNTNKAVDQVLYKICETLTHEHPAMEGGKVVRLGRVADDKLASKYRKYVAIDEIVERRSAELEEKKSQLEAEIAQIEAEIAQIDAQTQNEQFDKAKQQRDELVAEIHETGVEIAALRTTVLRDARIVGATCTTAYLTGDIGQFDLVIVDEASMVPRPEVWFSAGLSRERVVISGDFRQIPSIVTTEQEAIFQELGLDPFTATERTKPDAPGLIMLTTQFRMHPNICELISEPMYEGKLSTSPARKKVLGRLPPNPFEKPLTIIDTSDLGPIESQDEGSRFNKLHALLVRNFVRHLRLNGVVETNHDLGICTPYSAQAHQIQKLLKEDSPDDLVHCGTIHRFQGDERRIVLLEIPESGGHRHLGQFVKGVPPDHTGARLISVAVSRAQEHFVVLANLTHLDNRLPSRSLLRGILHKMEQQGRVVPGREFYKLSPIDQTDLPEKKNTARKDRTSAPSQRKNPEQSTIDPESTQPSASPSKPSFEPPSSPKGPVEHSRSTNSPVAGPLPLQNIEATEKVDLTIPAQKFLSCVSRTGEIFRISHIIKVLRGSRSKTVLKHAHDKLATYSIGREYSRKQWNLLVQQFIQQKLLTKNIEHGSIKLTDKGRDVLNGEQVGGIPVETTGEYDSVLFEQLRAKRKELADAEGIPPYMVFSDRALEEMATYFPHSKESFETMHGIGQMGVEKYGYPFLPIISTYCQQHGLTERPKLTARVGRSTAALRSRSRQVGERFQAGESIAELMRAYKIKRQTIILHLSKYVKAGNSLPVERLHDESSLSDEIKDRVLEIFDELGTDYLNPVFEAFDGTISYEELYLIRVIYWTVQMNINYSFKNAEDNRMNRQQAERLLQIAVSNHEARFRDGQWEAIDAVSNRRAKLLLVQRTGWGKSAVYFVATRIFRDAGRGPTIIVSPLLALMRNQVEAAQRLGIRAASIDSSNRDDWDAIITDVINDQIDALLITPERLANEDFRQSTLMKIADRIGLLVVDEAHCISDWGHDFRPDYRRLTNVLRMLPRNTPVLGTTATANDRVIGDIKTQLADFQIQRGPLSRHSLSLQTIRLDNQASRLAWLAQSIPQISGSGIVYVLTKRDAEQVAAYLSRHGISAQAYHGGADHDKRCQLENMLLNNEIKVLVATTALGMGYDKPDLSFVIHYQAPSSVVAYYQQVGRAGRAIPSAVGILLAGEEDEQIHDYFRRTAFPPEHTVEQVLDALEESDGKSILELQNQLNMHKSQIEHVLKVLSVEVPSPIIKVGSKWHRTAAEFELDRERIHRLSGQRDREWQEFQEYVDTDDCFMEYLGHMLDDPAAGRCGKCANCIGKPVIATTVEHALEVEAVRFLRRSELPFEPRKSIRKGVLPTYGFPDDRLVPELQASEGRILSQWGDAGWGALVAKDKQSEHFRDELVHAVAEMVLERWQPDPPAKWVACVPSLRCPALVPDFARRLADKLKLPFCDVIQKVRDCPPQKQQENTFHQCRNLDGAFKVVGRVPTSPVLLIDDVVDSRWTMTVLSALLRRSGSGLVYPVGLATAGIGG